MKWSIEQQKKNEQSFDELIHFLLNFCNELNKLIQQQVENQNKVVEDENFHFNNHQVEENNQDEYINEIQPNFINQEEQQEEQEEEDGDDDEEVNSEFNQICGFIQEIWRIVLIQQCIMLPIHYRSEIIHLLELPEIDRELILSRLNSMLQEQDFQEPILIKHFHTLHYSQELLQKTASLIK